MDHDEQVKTVYAHFGLASYLSQVLEHGIVNSMAYFHLIPSKAASIRSAEEWEKQVDDFMGGGFEKTLGGMIKALSAAVAIPPHLGELLSETQRRRNWLAHAYFRERASSLMTEVGRFQMIAELQDAQALFTRADAELEKIVLPLRKRYGLTDERLKKVVDRYLKEIANDIA